MGKPMKVAVNIILCHLLYRVQYENVEQIKKLNRCVICPNHTSIIDPFWIYEKADNLYIMAKAELFKNKLLGAILKHYNVFPVDRGKVDVKSTLMATNIFEKNSGNVQFLIFPEGKVIQNEEEIGRVKNGAVFVAATAGVPILPVHISRNIKKFHKVTIKFGEPIEINKEVLESKEKLQAQSKEIIKSIYKMERREVN